MQYPWSQMRWGQAQHCFFFLYRLCQHHIWVLGLVLIRNHVDTDMNIVNFCRACVRACVAVSLCLPEHISLNELLLRSCKNFTTYSCLINSIISSGKTGDSGQPMLFMYVFSIKCSELGAGGEGREWGNNTCEFL